MNRLLRRPWVIAAILALGVLIAGCLLSLRPYTGPQIAVAVAPDRLPAPRASWLNRVVPWSWSWFWTFKQVVSGKPRAVNLEATIFRFPPNVELNRFDFSLGEPAYVATNGIKAWVLEENDLKTLSGACLKVPGAEVLAKPRINTADEIQASLFCGQVNVLSSVTNPIGVSFDSYPRMHRTVTDLTTTFLVTEALTNGPSLTIRTNMDLTARVQLLRGRGFFLLNSRGNGSDERPIGVIVSAKVPKR